MAEAKEPILSVIVISHEQREELRHCLESILAMEIPFAYEIIVSDDRSKDGSFELAKEYEEKYPFILALQCNSDEGNCANNSQRSGYNRCNAYPHARGRYIAHVDADDYFRPGAKVYEKQVAALEAHPECALAMSTCVWKTEDKEIDECTTWSCKRVIEDGEIITAEEFIREDYFRINQCFMQRSNPSVDPVVLYGNRYVDSVISFHHLQYGPIVYVDAADYVYVQSPNSIAATTATSWPDQRVLWCLAIYISAMIPRWWPLFLQSDNYYWSVRDVLLYACQGTKMSPDKYRSVENLPVWIYGCFNRASGWFDKVRIACAIRILKMYKRNLMSIKTTAGLTRKLIFGR